MTSAINTPSNPDYPSAANTLFVSDTWSTTLNLPPSFSYALLKGTLRLAGGSVSMTPAQWAAWGSQDDEDYILSCVATNLGLTLQ